MSTYISVLALNCTEQSHYSVTCDLRAQHLTGGGGRQSRSTLLLLLLDLF